MASELEGSFHHWIESDFVLSLTAKRVPEEATAFLELALPRLTGDNHILIRPSEGAEPERPDEIAFRVASSRDIATSGHSPSVMAVQLTQSGINRTALRALASTAQTLSEIIAADVERARAVRAIREASSFLRWYRACLLYLSRPPATSQGAMSQLREVEAEAATVGLSERNKRRLAGARKSLQMFEYAEGLGSLLRLHGWLDAGLVRQEETAEKIRRCFNQDELRLAARDDSVTELAIAGYRKLIAVLTGPLSAKYRVGFRIRLADSSDYQEIRPDDEASIVPVAEVHVPPLLSTGDEAAVLIGLSVGLLEPLRNAAKHLHDHSAEFSSRARIPKVDVVLRRTGCCEVKVLIGNPVFGSRKEKLQQSIVHGVVLVDRLLTRTSSRQYSPCCS